MLEALSIWKTRAGNASFPGVSLLLLPLATPAVDISAATCRNERLVPSTYIVMHHKLCCFICACVRLAGRLFWIIHVFSMSSGIHFDQWPSCDWKQVCADILMIRIGFLTRIMAYLRFLSLATRPPGPGQTCGEKAGLFSNWERWWCRYWGTTIH